MQEETNDNITGLERAASTWMRFRWQVRGQVAGTAYPSSGAMLFMLRRLGIRALLNLTEDVHPPELLAEENLQAEPLPIPNFHTPTIAQIEQAITIINRFRAEDRPVAVHCSAGVGRTGTILACYLVWQGASAEEAIERVRSLQPSCIETPEQQAAVRAYELYLRPGL